DRTFAVRERFANARPGTLPAMKTNPLLLSIVLAACASSPQKQTGPNAEATAKAEVAGLQKMCDESAEARKQRHAAKALYQRLGGRAAIRAVVAEVVAMKEADELTKPTMAGVDREKMIENS